MLGKLKHSLKERCPECGKNLEIRVISEQTIQRGAIIIIHKEYVCCSNRDCEFRKQYK